MPPRRSALAAARRVAGLTQEDVAHRVGVDRSTVQRWEAGGSDPQPWVRRKLTALLGVDLPALDALLAATPPAATAAQATTAPAPAAPPFHAVDDELDALELARRAAASDVGAATLDQLERAVDDLASSYATSAPASLLTRTRTHLGYVTRLLDGRTTLREHRRLLVAGGWLSLLAATLHVDLGQQGPAVARMRTAASLADECGHVEIGAWCLETEAWRVLTLGDHGAAARLAQGAQDLAPVGSSALIQATAQEGRARARLGDARSTTRIVGAVNRMADPLATPDSPEHHYRYDPAKAMSYTATTLSWVGDPAAVDHAREVIRNLGASDGGRPRRLAVARLDLALALIPRGETDEAVNSTLVAVTSGHVAPSNRWRAREVIRAAERSGIRDAGLLLEAYADMVKGEGWTPTARSVAVTGLPGRGPAPALPEPP